MRIESKDSQEQHDYEALTEEAPPTNPAIAASRRSTLVPVLLILLVVIGAGIWFLLIRRGADSEMFSANQISGIRVGAIAPDFDLVDVSTGAPVRLSSMLGKPVWINFWATWCPSCATELPLMQSMYEKYKGRGLVIVGIDEREDPDTVRQYVAKAKYGWTFVVDRDGEVTNRFYVGGIPEHIFVDSAGVIQGLQIGELSAGAMEDQISKIIPTPTR